MTTPDADLFRDLDQYLASFGPKAHPQWAPTLASALLERCRAALAEQVPREPTEAMLTAAEALSPPFGPPEHLTAEYCTRWRERQRNGCAASWRTMYDAAIAASRGDENG